MKKLKGLIKLQLDISENITFHHKKNKDLNSETLISELYNTNENALEIVIDGKIIYDQN